jgi:hypothetical protein
MEARRSSVASRSGSEPEQSTMPESLLWSEIPRSRSSGAQKDWEWELDWWSAEALRWAVRAVLWRALRPFSMHLGVGGSWGGLVGG